MTLDSICGEGCKFVVLFCLRIKFLGGVLRGFVAHHHAEHWVCFGF